jgi:hypothetical protein
MRQLIAVLMLTSAAQAAPRDEVRSALRACTYDVQLERLKHTRFLSMAGVAEADRKQLAAMASLTVNSVASSPTLEVLPTNGDLLVVDLARYGINPAAWEALASDHEPFFHIRTKVIDPRTGKQVVVQTDAGHVGLEHAARLRLLTGSSGAVLRAGWFVRRVTSDHYYSFEGVPDTLDGWYKSVGADPKVIVGLAANRGTNLLRSDVTRKKRRLSRWQGPLGAVWQTYDSEVRDDPRHDPFRFPGFAGGEYDASEHIAVKANGLLKFGLYDRQGKRQFTVPDKIAKDDSDPHTDGVLTAARSCIQCHTDDGYRTFGNDMTAVINDLKGYDAERLKAFYATDRLDIELKRDREDYATAVEKACGLPSKEVPTALAKVLYDHQWNTVDLATAARELGVKHVGVFIVSNDPYLLALLDGKRINRTDWEDSFNEAAMLTSGGR